jgi:folate-dependent phosphoribosylglycinamide formyltransferase PurN
MPPGDTLQQKSSSIALQHYCDFVHTMGYIQNFILSALSAGLVKTKKKYITLHPSLPPKA